MPLSLTQSKTYKSSKTIGQHKMFLSLITEKYKKSINAQMVEYIMKYKIGKTFGKIFLGKPPTPPAIILLGWKSAN